MNDYILIGKIVNTHGIKGELRILSDFEYKEKVFKVGTLIYIGKNKDEKNITSYRHHKVFEMITIDNINDINTVLKYKGELVYIKKEILELKSDEYLLSDLIGCEIIEKDKNYGQVEEIVKNNTQILLFVVGKKNFYIPKVKKYINKVDIVNKKIYTNEIEELLL